MPFEPPISIGGLKILAPPSISPSSFRCARQCRLRALLNAGGTPSLLPSHPSTYIGITAHRLLDAAQRGKTGNPPEPLKLARRWRYELTQMEQRIATDSRKRLDRALLPLKRSCVDLERRRLRTMRLASSVEVATMATGSGSNIERRLISQDGQLVGKADRLVFTGGRATLRDYKTGPITTDSGSIKDAYVDQLHLYGALLLENEPSLLGRLTLELVDSQGVKHPFAFREDHASDLAKKARLELAALTRAALDIGMGRATLQDLASVSASHCSDCQFRPSCPAWLDKLDTHGAIALGPVIDLSRNFVDRHQLSGKLIAVRLADAELVTGLGVPEEDSRSAAITSARPGDRLRVFNLRPPKRQFAPYVAQSTTFCTLAAIDR